MLAYLLAIVGIAQICFAVLSFLEAKSNIHEIFAAVLFTGGVLEIGVGAILAQLGDMDATAKRLLEAVEANGARDRVV